MSKKIGLIGELVRYGSTTLLSAACSLGIPILLHEVMGVAEKPAAAAGFFASYLLNIVLLRSFVFRSKNRWQGDVVRYVLASGLMRLLEYGAFVLLLDMFNVDYRLSILIVLGTSTLLKYFIYKRAFGEKRSADMDAELPPR